MKKTALEFLQKLCDAPGPSGFEREPARMTRAYIEPFCDEISCDKLGSLIFKKNGPSPDAPVIFLPGHADEIGFIISGIHKNGYLKFHPLGGWPDHVLMAQRVTIMARSGLVSGVISAKPIHLMSPKEREKLVKKEKMFIDIGAANAEEAVEMGVRVGDAVVPQSTFSTFTKKVFKKGKPAGDATLAWGKAFDNRAGLFIAAEVVRRLAEENIEHPCTVVGSATTMEEVGLRGAGTAGYQVDPDVCITLDVSLAGDEPGVEPHEAPANMGDGVSISCFDRSMIPNQGLKELAIETAEREKIPYKLTTLFCGGTDAGAVHRTRAGCPSIYIGPPTRHIHSHVGLIDLADIEACIDLTVAMIRRMDAEMVASFTAI